MLCKLCGEDKAQEDFYASNRVTCKPCHRARVTARRAENIDEIRAYDRSRDTAPKRKAAVSDRAHRYKSRRREYLRKYLAKFPEKHKARLALRRMRFSGEITPPLACEACGKQSRLEGHHHDYSKPGEVAWLCRQCHGAEHRRLNEEKRKSL